MGAIFANDIFSCIILNENCRTSIQIPRKFVLKGLIDNMPVLVQILAWRLSDNKPLSAPMLTLFTNSYMQH